MEKSSPLWVNAASTSASMTSQSNRVDTTSASVSGPGVDSVAHIGAIFSLNPRMRMVSLDMVPLSMDGAGAPRASVGGRGAPGCQTVPGSATGSLLTSGSGTGTGATFAARSGWAANSARTCCSARSSSLRRFL
jgi:hypothetical protein